MVVVGCAFAGALAGQPIRNKNNFFGGGEGFSRLFTLFFWPGTFSPALCVVCALFFSCLERLLSYILLRQITPYMLQRLHNDMLRNRGWLSSLQPQPLVMVAILVCDNLRGNWIVCDSLQYSYEKQKYAVPIRYETHHLSNLLKCSFYLAVWICQLCMAGARFGQARFGIVILLCLGICSTKSSYPSWFIGSCKY